MNSALQLILAIIAAIMTVSGSSASLSITPESQTVNPGETFTVSIRQDAGVVTTGVQTSFNFDQNLLQITDVAKGAAYTTGTLVVGVAPQTRPEAIAEANETGTLLNLGVFFFPGQGTVPPGDAESVVITFQARSGVNGTSNLTLTETEKINSLGETVEVEIANGRVVVGEELPPSATPTPTNTLAPGETPQPTHTPTNTPMPTSTRTPRPPTATPEFPPTATPVPVAHLMLAPTSLTVPPGSRFQVTIKQEANVSTTGAEADFEFDEDLLQVIAVDKSTVYARASLIYGEVLPSGEQQTGPAAITAANQTGILKNVATFFIPGTGSVPAGSNDFVLITLEARGTDGRSEIGISETSLINEAGESVPADGNSGEIVVLTGAPPPPTPSAAGSGSFTSFVLPDTLPATGSNTAPASGPDWKFAVVAACFVLPLIGGIAVRFRRPRR